MERIKLSNGEVLFALLIKVFSNGKLFYLNENLVKTDLNNVEIVSINISDLVENIL